MTKEKINFISKVKRLQIWNAKDTKLAQFEDMGGGYGAFSTDDEVLVESLKQHPDFNKAFFALEGAKFPKFYSLRYHVGAQTSSTKEPDLEKIKANEKALAQLEAAKQVAEIKAKVKRFGELEGKWKKQDGEFRKDAPTGEIEEYNKLKQEIGEI